MDSDTEQQQPQAESPPPENPWKTINEELIQNRCWLCQNTFARGKTKKVFMLSHLLRYLEERYKLEQMVAQDPSTPTCRQLTMEVAAAVGSDAAQEGLSLDMLKVLSARNLRYCYEEFKAKGGDQAAISTRLQAAECETWMSGLICARTPECAQEFLLVVPDGKVSSAIMAGESGYVGGSRAGDCDPGCGCDNPWLYIQAALVDTEQK